MINAQRILPFQYTTW